jgi:phage baseplate assembly protein W
MTTLGVKLPITRNSVHGFTMIEEVNTLIRQNLKMLVLTNPGERVMMPDFGVGIGSYLFENFSESIFVDIADAITRQAKKYLPVIIIRDIKFDSAAIEYNTLGVKIAYSIPSLNIEDLLEFTT